MKYIQEKVSYLKGLSDGLGLDDSTNEGKVILKMLDVLDDITDALDGLMEAQDELEDYVEMIDDDMTDLEEYILEDDMAFADEDDEYYEDDDDLYEVICPSCGSAYLTDFESFEEDEVFCPECGEQFKLEEKVVEELTHADGCQCGQHHE
ncbi:MULTISPECIES: CD1247 N-terminal domain-containing protein [Eubacterium]|uniref:Uncharacterized protein n=1 Tax=Eubacterium barkeri TaxID=1528 RepID=A0A1H3E6Z4_EUBBA|nr:CD1247 N-terminal domain-containing protein [Eubacterium barkeri]SDX73704.1 hypothetical protein SAMN04488579_106105 [Eubacterium barkeri]